MAESKPNYKEIVTAGRKDSVTKGWLENSVIQSNPDEILRQHGRGDFSIYEELLRDDQVRAVFQQRRLALISKEWEVIPASDNALDVAAADFIRKQVKKIKFDDKTDKMMYGIFYGYAVAEILWAQKDGMVVIDQIKVRKAKRFKFDKLGGLRLITRDKMIEGELMPKNKFWSFNTGADNDDNLYGEGLAKALYWPVFFKRNDIKFWLVFLEKYGMPTAKGEFMRGASQNEKDTILEALDAIQTDSAIAVPAGTIIELVEASRGGTADYSEMHRIMDGAIAKIILSQTMTTDNGSSLSQAQVHSDVKNEVVTADAGLICESFNEQVVQCLMDWNFPNASAPSVWRKTDIDIDMLNLANRDKVIFDIGYEPTQEYIDQTYGNGFVKKQAVTPVSAQFSEHTNKKFTPDQQAIEELLDAMHMLSPINKIVIKSAIRSATSPEDLEVRLASVLDKSDLTKFSHNLEKALFAADIMGYAHA